MTEMKFSGLPGSGAPRLMKNISVGRFRNNPKSLSVSKSHQCQKRVQKNELHFQFLHESNRFDYLDKPTKHGSDQSGRKHEQSFLLGHVRLLLLKRQSE
jgi:hypothetical protein